MNYTDNQIEQYIRGRMSERGRAEFEQSMAANPALRRSVQIERAIVDAVRRDGAAQAAGTEGTIPAAIAARLAATPAAVGITLGTGAGVLGMIFGTKIGITILSTVGAIGIILGALLIAPLFKEVPSDTKKENSLQQGRNAFPETIPGQPNSNTSTPNGAGSGTGVESNAASSFSEKGGEVRVPQSSLSGRKRATEEIQKGNALGDKAAASHDGTPPSAQQNTSQEMLKQLQREEKGRSTPTVKKGSAEVKVKVE